MCAVRPCVRACVLMGRYSAATGQDDAWGEVPPIPEATIDGVPVGRPRIPTFPLLTQNLRQQIEMEKTSGSGGSPTSPVMMAVDEAGWADIAYGEQVTPATSPTTAIGSPTASAHLDLLVQGVGVGVGVPAVGSDAVASTAVCDGDGDGGSGGDGGYGGGGGGGASDPTGDDAGRVRADESLAVVDDEGDGVLGHSATIHHHAASADGETDHEDDAEGSYPIEAVHTVDVTASGVGRTSPLRSAGDRDSRFGDGIDGSVDTSSTGRIDSDSDSDFEGDPEADPMLLLDEDGGVSDVDAASDDGYFLNDVEGGSSAGGRTPGGSPTAAAAGGSGGGAGIFGRIGAPLGGGASSGQSGSMSYVFSLVAGACNHKKAVKDSLVIHRGTARTIRHGTAWCGVVWCGVVCVVGLCVRSTQLWLK